MEVLLRENWINIQLALHRYFIIIFSKNLK